MTRAIVIGAGMSGLTAAAYLQRDGFEVTIYEQSDTIGGVTRTMKKDGFTWDIGPMIIEGLGPGEPGGLVLRELGLDKRLKLIPGERGVVFPDFSIFRPDRYEGSYWRRERLKEIFPDEVAGLDRFYKLIDIITDLVTLERRSVVSGPVRALFLKLGMALLFLRVRKYKEWTADRLMDFYFKDEKLKALFTAILADLVVLPSEFIGLGIPFFNQEKAYDSRIREKRVFGIGPKRVNYYFVSGGIGSLADAVSDIVTEKGGRIHTNSPIKKILTEGDSVIGVELEDGTTDKAPLVMVSGGARECFFGLLGRERLPSGFTEKIDDIPLMESVFMVQLGVEIDPTPYQKIPVVYYINTYDIEHGVYLVRSGKYHEGKDGFVIYINSLHSPEMAPEGMHSITIYTIAPSEIEGGWEGVRDEMTEKLLIEAEKVIPGLRDNAKVMITLAPSDFKGITYMQEHHSFGGMCPIMGKDAAPHETPYRGLWFIGSQSEAGAGVWNQLLGSRKVVRMAVKGV